MPDASVSKLRYFAYDAAAPGEEPPAHGTWYVAMAGRTEGGPEQRIREEAGR